MSNEAATLRGEIKLQLDSIDRWRVKIETLIDKHDHALFGNGQPGMDEQIRETYRIIKDMQKEKEKAWEWWQKYLFWFLTFAVSQFVTLYFSGFFVK